MARLGSLTDSQLDAMRSALANGATLRDLSDRYGVSYEAAKKWRQRDRAEQLSAGSAEGGEQVRVSITDGQVGEAVSRVYPEAAAHLLSNDDLLRGWGLAPDEWEIIDGSLGVNRWMITGFDADTGLPVENWNYQYKARVRRVLSAEEAELPSLVRVKVQVKVAREPKRARTDLACAVLIPDCQIGFFRAADDSWRPFHDEAALDILHQVIADAEAEHGIDRVVNVGDFIDATHASTHRSAPAQIDRAGFHRALVKAQAELATITALTPNAQRDLIPGNHEQRVINWLTDNAGWLMGVTLPNAPDGLLSLENLLGTAEHGWALSDPYPEGIVWLNKNTRCLHGWVAKGVPGASAAEYLRDEVNTFFGHTPRAQSAHRTVARGAETRTYVAHTPGGLMRVDGAVPSGTTATRINGEPALSRGERWEQGFSIVFYCPDGSTVPVIEHVPIFGGRAVWRGREYVAACDADGRPVT